MPAGHKRVQKALRERCRNAWSTAIELDAACHELLGGVPVPEGLVLIDRHKRGEAPIISDLNQIVELNKKAIQTALELQKILAELKQIPTFRSRSGK